MEEGGSGLMVVVFVGRDQAGPAGKWSRGAKPFGSALAQGNAQSYACCAWKSLGSFLCSGTVSASEPGVMCQPGALGESGTFLG